MRTRKLAIAIVQLSLAASLSVSAYAQASRVGIALNQRDEVKVVMAGLRTIEPDGQVLINPRRVCGMDLLDPDCSRSLQGLLKGPLYSMTTYGAILAEIVGGRSLEEVPNERSPRVNVQRPLLVGDSIFMMLMVSRLITEHIRDTTAFDFILRLDADSAIVVRRTIRERDKIPR